MISQSAKRAVKGATKSWTMWFAVALAVAGALQLEADHVGEYISREAFGLFNILIGVAVAVLRVLTTTSLEEKGDGQ